MVNSLVEFQTFLNRREKELREKLPKMPKEMKLELIDKYKAFVNAKKGAYGKPNVDVLEILQDALREYNIDVIDGYLLRKFELELGDVAVDLDDDVTLRVYRNTYYLEIVKKKGDEVRADKKTIFDLLEASNIIDPIDNKTYKYIKVLTLQKGGIKEVDILNGHLEEAFSSMVQTYIFKEPILRYKLVDALNELISISNKYGTIGWGLGLVDNQIKELDVIRPQRVFFTSTFDTVMDILKNTTVTDVFKEHIVDDLVMMNKPHNILCFISCLMGFLIHIAKPTVVPNVYLFGASARGKTFMADLVSFVQIPYATTTIHQYLQHTSGFRCGCAFWDEKWLWGGEILQEVFKQSATNLRKVTRMSKDILYISNVVSICPSNPTPKFLVNSSSEFEAVIRRGWFLHVRPEDRIEEKLNFGIIELNKFKILKMFIEEVKKLDPSDVIGLSNADKFELLEALFEILVNIIPYSDEDFKKLKSRLEESEGKIFVEAELADEIVGVIIRESLNISAKLREPDILSDMVQKRNLQINGFCLQQDGGKVYVYITLRGWKKLGIQDFANLDDVVDYLSKNKVVCEKKRVMLYERYYTVIEIGADNIVTVEDLKEEAKKIATPEDVVNYIENAGGKVKEWELEEKFGKDVVKKAYKEGYIDKVEDEYFV